MVTMSSVFFMMNENKLDIHHDEVKAFVLQEEAIETPQSETFYRELLDNDKDDILVLSKESNVKVASTEFDEIKDQNFFTLVHPDDLPEIGNAFMEAEESGGTVGPVRLKTSTDEYKPYVISMESLENEAGEKISTALTLKDTSKAIGEKDERVTKRNDDREDKRETEEIKEQVADKDDHDDDVDKSETEEINKRVTDRDDRDVKDPDNKDTDDDDRDDKDPNDNDRDDDDHDDNDRDDQRVVKVKTSDRDTNDRDSNDRDSRPTKRKISDKKR